MGLNKEQQEVASHIDGPLLAVAGAGSGKTTTMIHRIENLLNHGIKPWNILAVTFTNKAAAEMKERLIAKVGKDKTKGIWMTTFHSACSRILMEEAKNTTLIPENFTIFDTSKSKETIKNVLTELELTSLTNEASMQHAISTLKNEMIDVETFENNTPSNEYIDWEYAQKVMNTIENKQLTLLVYKRYEELLRFQKALDFDDLIMKTIQLFIQYPNILKKYQEKFKYVNIDEFQDTNHSQSVIIHMLTHIHQNIVVYGDDYQAIYRFRGGRVEKILNFEHEYQDVKVVKMVQNYRSTKNIIEAANSVIAHNEKQLEKKMTTDNDEGDKVQVHLVHHPRLEAEYIANRIQKLHIQQGEAYTNNVVLYRSNFQSLRVQQALTNLQIPFKIIGGKSLFERQEIRYLFNYLELIVNPNDGAAFQQIINVPKREIGIISVGKILNKITLSRSILDILKDPHDITRMRKDAKVRAKTFAEMIERYRLKVDQVSPEALLMDLIQEINFEHHFAKEEKRVRDERSENIQEFLRIIRENKREDEPLSEYLVRLRIQFSGGVSDDDEDVDYVTLMTIHSSKGLEYENVFITGMNEDIFPSSRSVTDEDKEEERRLCYVGMTRAKKRLFLTYSRIMYKVSKNDYGEVDFEEIPLKPSTFLNEISNKYKQNYFH